MSTLSGSSRDTHSEIISIAFDGRKDDTQHMFETSLGKKIVQCHKEEHITVLCEPGSTYIDHFTVENGQATTIAKELLDIVYSSNSKDTLRAICCDGTRM